MLRLVEGWTKETEPAEETRVSEATPPRVDSPEPPAVGGDGAGATEAENPAGLASLSPSVKKAWASWKLAEANHTAKPQDRQAYDWLAEQPDETFIGDLVGYKLPAAATWQRYVREARNAVGENKNLPRAGRTAGGSVFRQGEI